MSAALVAEQLSDADFDDYVAELAKHVGAVAARRPSWLRRAVRAPDGWRVVVRRPVIGLSERNRARPWDEGKHFPSGGPGKDDPGMQVETVHLPIAEAVALLQGDQNPEREIERRQGLADAFWAADARRLAEERERMDGERRRREEYRRARPDRWRALPRDVQALFVAVAAKPQSPGLALLEYAAALQSTKDFSAEAPPAVFEPEHAS